MERRAEEIRLYAKLGFLIYADGYTAKIAGQKPAKDKNDNDVWEFILDPSDELIKRYNIKPNNSGDMVYRVQLPYELIVQLNPDPAWTRWLYLGTYDNQSSPPSVEILKGTSQQKEIMELKKRLLIEKAKREVAEEKARLIENRLPEYLKKNFTPIMEQFTPIFEKLNPSRDK